MTLTLMDLHDDILLYLLSFVQGNRTISLPLRGERSLHMVARTCSRMRTLVRALVTGFLVRRQNRPRQGLAWLASFRSVETLDLGFATKSRAWLAKVSSREEVVHAWAFKLELADIRVIVSLPRLQHLDLVGCAPINSQVLSAVGTATGLRTLCLVLNGRGGPLHLRTNLSNLSKLERLAVIGNDNGRDSGDSLKDMLKAMPRLNALIADSNNRLTHAALCVLPSLPMLSHLELTHANIGPEPSFSALAALSPCPSVCSLRVSHCISLEDDHLAALLQALPSLQMLEVEQCPRVTGEAFHVLRDRETGLRHVGLPGCYYVQGAWVAQNLNAEHLVSLSLATCPRIPDGSLQLLKGLTALQSLDISQNRMVSGEGLRGLGGPEGLRQLWLRHCSQVTNDMVAIVCAEHAKLEMLSLEGCHALKEPALLAIGSRLNDLKSLDVSGATVRTHAVAHLLSLRELVTLNLCGSLPRRWISELLRSRQLTTREARKGLSAAMVDLLGQDDPFRTSRQEWTLSGQHFTSWVVPW